MRFLKIARNIDQDKERKFSELIMRALKNYFLLSDFPDFKK
jgi:hypothetical protein